MCSESGDEWLCKTRLRIIPKQDGIILGALNESRREESLHCLFCRLLGAESCIQQDPASQDGMYYVTGTWGPSSHKGVRTLGNCTLWVGNPVMGSRQRQAQVVGGGEIWGKLQEPVTLPERLWSKKAPLAAKEDPYSMGSNASEPFPESSSSGEWPTCYRPTCHLRLGLYLP